MTSRENSTQTVRRAKEKTRVRPRLMSLGAGAVTELALPEQGEAVIGRGDGVDLKIDEPSVSRRHARVLAGPPLRIEDLGSQNGTCVDGRELEKGATAVLNTGSVVEVGATTWVVHGSVPVARESAPAAAMKQIWQLVDRVAASHLSVLVLGETGTGKTLLAEQLHRKSARAQKPLLKVNCAAIAENLLESELFGHEKGAFTGATQAKRGLLETADGGTVFLDEIGELPQGLQAKLLHVIEQREVQPVGGLKPRPIDVRFVSATHRDLAALSAKGGFRQDLYFRLNGISLTLPPLRARLDELEDLVRGFISQAAKQSGLEREPALSPRALARLMQHRWPGNIRELRNVIERAVVLCGGDVLEEEHFPELGGPAVEAESVAPVLAPDELLERQRIVDALEKCVGNQTRAAKLLGISRSTLLERMNRFALPRPRR